MIPDGRGSILTPGVNTFTLTSVERADPLLTRFAVNVTQGDGVELVKNALQV